MIQVNIIIADDSLYAATITGRDARVAIKVSMFPFDARLNIWHPVQTVPSARSIFGWTAPSQRSR